MAGARVATGLGQDRLHVVDEAERAISRRSTGSAEQSKGSAKREDQEWAGNWGHLPG